MTNECICGDCKNCSPVITQEADYYCGKKNIYMTWTYIYISRSCDEFEQDNRTMKEKEEEIW